MTAERPLQMSPDELAYHKDLVAQVDAQKLRETTAKAVWLQTQLDLQAVTNSHQAFMNHLGRRYGLLDNDVIDAEGRFHYLDPQWAMIAAAEAQAQAVAQADQATEEAPAHAAQGIEDMVALDGEDLAKAVVMDPPAPAETPKKSSRRNPI